MKVTSPTATAVRIYEEEIVSAEGQYRLDVRAAEARRDAALEQARKDCQAVLDAEAPEGIKITISFKGIGSESR